VEIFTNHLRQCLPMFSSKARNLQDMLGAKIWCEDTQSTQEKSEGLLVGLFHGSTL
jgi:hypothetical protein